MARLVDGLDSLRHEFDAVNPRRDHGSDGWVGNEAHKATISDHNPDDHGVVHAIDVDVDGVPMGRVVAFLVGECRAGRETRLQYIIYRRTIWSRTWGWTARRYRGSNPHTRHAHFSSRYGAAGRSARAWKVAARFGPTAGGPESEPAPAPRPRPAGKNAPGSRRLVLRSPALSGADVRYAQRWIGEEWCGPADSEYGPRSVAGVKRYQRMRGLAADGIVGPTTWRHLGVRWTGGKS